MVINDNNKDVYRIEKNPEYINDNIRRELITREFFKEIKTKEALISIIEKN